jgi:hypothetical protein
MLVGEPLRKALRALSEQPTLSRGALLDDHPRLIRAATRSVAHEF